MTDHPMSCYPGQFELWDCAIPFEPTLLDWCIAGEYNRDYRYMDDSERIMLTNLVNCAIARAMIASRSGQIKSRSGDGS